MKILVVKSHELFISLIIDINDVSQSGGDVDSDIIIAQPIDIVKQQ